MRKINFKRSKTTIDNLIIKKRKQIVEKQMNDFLKLFSDGWIKHQYDPETNEDVFITSPLKNYLDEFSKFAKWNTRRWNTFNKFLKRHHLPAFTIDLFSGEAPLKDNLSVIEMKGKEYEGKE